MVREREKNVICKYEFSDDQYDHHTPAQPQNHVIWIVEREKYMFPKNSMSCHVVYFFEKSEENIIF